MFTLYALDTKVSLPSGANREQLMSEVEGHILAQTDTVGKFQVAESTEGGRRVSILKWQRVLF